jgi:hypothetical protein
MRNPYCQGVCLHAPQSTTIRHLLALSSENRRAPKGALVTKRNPNAFVPIDRIISQRPFLVKCLHSVILTRIAEPREHCSCYPTAAIGGVAAMCRGDGDVVRQVFFTTYRTVSGD